MPIDRMGVQIQRATSCSNRQRTLALHPSSSPFTFRAMDYRPKEPGLTVTPTGVYPHIHARSWTVGIHPSIILSPFPSSASTASKHIRENHRSQPLFRNPACQLTAATRSHQPLIQKRNNN
ncbi:hypothetical protein KC341_g2 [Hortaea werneckii]|nr:hypothetical protein KC341_g2 [Hortaea werneckii]